MGLGLLSLVLSLFGIQSPLYGNGPIGFVFALAGLVLGIFMLILDFDFVEQGVADGVFEAAHPRDACRAVVTMCTSVSHWYRPDGALSSSELAQRYCAIALAAVGCRTVTRG